MREIEINEKEAGQRFDKFLGKYLKEANKSFIYKMLRKKNITWNNNKSDGSQKLAAGDSIQFYMAEETIEKFRGEGKAVFPKEEADKCMEPLSVLYEDKHVLFINKPAGMLSQKAKPSDISLIEYMTAYLIETGSLTAEEQKTFHPGICNRLDRNTSGVIAAGKTMEGLQVMGQMFKDRTLDKYYYCIVKGVIEKKEQIEGYLYKNHNHNKVTIHKEAVEGANFIKTQYEPVLWNEDFTLLCVKLITGKSHQIRAHLQSIGHPIVGDGKYGDVAVNKYFRKKWKLKHQLLHAAKLVFPEMKEGWEDLSKRCILAPFPDYFEAIVCDCFSGGEAFCRHGIQED